MSKCPTLGGALRLVLIFLLFAGPASLLPAQQFTWSWAWTLQDSSSGFISDVAFGSNGTLFAIGDHRRTVDLDPGAGTQFYGPNSSRDGFVIKLDSNHNLLWTQRVAGTHVDALENLTVDVDDNVYYEATVQGTVDIHPGPDSLILSAMLGDDAFMVKLNANGDFQWAAVLHCDPSNGDIYDFAVDQNGDVVIIGEYSGTADFDPGPGTYTLASSSGDRQSFVWKLNSEGQLIWVKEFERAFYQGTYVEVTSQSHILMSGIFNDTVDFDPGPSAFDLMSLDGNDAFVLLLDSAGNFQWVRQFGNLSNVQCRGLQVGLGDAIYVLLDYNAAPLDIDPGAGVMLATHTNGLGLVRLDDQGNYVWGLDTEWEHHSQGGNSFLAYNGDVYLASSFMDNGDYNPGAGSYVLTPTGFMDGYLVKVNGSGVFQFVAKFPSSNLNNDQIEWSGMTVNSAGRMVLGGKYYGQVDLDPTFGTANYYSNNFDGCLVELDDVGFILSASSGDGDLAAPRVFPNPNAGRFQVDLGGVMKWAEIGVYDVSGRRVWADAGVKGGTVEVDLEGALGAGLYLVRVRSSKGVWSCRMVVE